MLIYNHKKEFIGISEKDLHHFNFSNLTELQSESADFADLFVKVPGHIHNFKHVHWLDFISSADSVDENKVIISAKGKTYKAILKLHQLFLTDAPSKMAYGVELSNIRELSNEETEKISGDLAQRSIDLATKPIQTPTVQTDIEANEHEEFFNFENESKEVEDPYAVVEPADEIALDTPTTTSYLDQNDKIDLDFDDTPTTPQKQEQTPPQQTSSVAYLDEDDPFKDYVYDPEVASNDLGLPIDLVEEFIEDFIAQANEFKEDMYNSLNDEDWDTLKSTSHKLKGVAANLRIEDAYEALVIINTSDDTAKIRKNMDKFYNIILKKLSGEPIEVQTQPQAVVEPEVESQQKDPLAEEEPFELFLDEDVDNSKDEEEAPLKLSLDDEITSPTNQNDEVALELIEEKEEKFDLSLEEEQTIENNQEETPFELTLEEVEQPKEEEEEAPLELSLDDDIANKEDTNDEEIPIDFETNAHKPILDKVTLMEKMGLDSHTFNSLLEEYITDTKQGLEELEHSIIQGDEVLYKKKIIQLKGMSDAMFLENISKDFELLLTDKSADKMAIIDLINKKLDSIK